jgi:hypothetical protein
MMTYFEKIWEYKTANFTVELSVAPEDIPPDDDFMFETEQERKDLLEDINEGRLEWFIARVRVLWDGKEIASDYLGGCCYKSFDEFRHDHYFYSMVGEAIKEARQYFAALTIPKIRTA